MKGMRHFDRAQTALRTAEFLSVAHGITLNVLRLPDRTKLRSELRMKVIYETKLLTGAGRDVLSAVFRRDKTSILNALRRHAERLGTTYRAGKRGECQTLAQIAPGEHLQSRAAV